MIAEPRAQILCHGPLGPVVAAALERGSPRWRIVRGSKSELVIADRDLPRCSDRATLVLGRDLALPFTVVELRRAALAKLKDRDDPIVAIDPPLVRALEIIEGTAEQRAPILITGPTGVGKELLARRVHERSKRPGMFIAINCASISLHLAESMLFGHKKGAFTGAIADAPGAFAEADGGTLFLDEIGELDLGLQAKLLRALETASIAPVGDVKERPVDVRVVAATNRNLPAEMRAGRFRADLYYRLAAFLIDIPELAARPGDLRALLLRCELSHRRAGEIELSPAARAALLEHRWPGNVRELRNVIERVMSLAKGPIVEAIDLQHLAPEVAQERRPRGSLEEMESEQIRRALEERGSVQEAADALGIHRSTLWRKLKRSRALSL